MRPLFTLLLCLFVSESSAQETSLRFSTRMVLGDRELISVQPATDEYSAALQIFRQIDGEWSHSATILVPEAVPRTGFGQSVVLDGDLLAIGAPGYENGIGQVFLYYRGEDGWTGPDIKVGPDTTSWFGHALGLHGDLLVVGAPGNNSAHVIQGLVSDSPSTYTVMPDMPGEDDGFGSSVATDGERVYVGAPNRNDLAGAVYVFSYSENGYVQEAELTSPGNYRFGRSLFVLGSGNIIAPAPGLTSRDRMQREKGPIRFTPATGPVLELTKEDSGVWSTSIALDSLMTIRGATSGRITMQSGKTYLQAVEDNDSLNQDRPWKIKEGESYLLVDEDAGINRYTKNGGTWTLKASLEPEDAESGLGRAIAVYGDQVALLASGPNYGLGAIVFTDANLNRTGRLAMVPEVALASSGPADCNDGRADQFGCSNVDMLSFVSIKDLGGEANTSLNDIWGWTDPETGKEYALVGRTDGTAFVDISDPAMPAFVGDLPLTEGANPSSWRDIKVYNDHAFIVADNAGPHGMQVFDLRTLRDVQEMPADFSPLTVYDGVGSAHNIVINEASGYAYIVGGGRYGKTCGGGLHMVNLSDPLNPQYVGCFSDTETGRSGRGYSHDAQCVIYEGPDTRYQNREVCFSSNETALSIADVTQKENPIALSNASYPNVSYAHQGWLTEDHAFYYMNDELDEMSGNIDGTRTLVWDVVDLEDPQLVGEYYSGNASSDHNLYIRGDFMYQSNYASGLRIFDISDRSNPVEVGHFDMVTLIPDAPGFIGSWSNYPYFESGTIAVTGIDEGLFLLKKRDLGL